MAQARRLFKAPDSRLVDRALQALIDEIEEETELRALERFPYDEDRELAVDAADLPELPYAGKVPKKVQALARARRRP